MIVIDIGNKHSTISNGKQSLTQRTSILIHSTPIPVIGASPKNHHVLYDFMCLLGVNFQEDQFARNTKYYLHNFEKNKYGKIDVCIDSGNQMKFKKFHIETLMALYLKGLIQKFSSIIAPPESQLCPQLPFHCELYDSFIKSHKFFITTNGGFTHSQRLALYQTCQILGIGSPIFLSALNTHILSYYALNHANICSSKSEICCVVSIGDKATTVNTYRLHSSAQKIVEALSTRSIRVGGDNFTKLIAEYIIGRIKKEKGIDIEKNSVYMNMLLHQSEYAKIDLSAASQDLLEKQSLIRISGLPDDSDFSQVINQTLFSQIVGSLVKQLVNFVEEIVIQSNHIQRILFYGKTTQMEIFSHQMRSVQHKYKIREIVSFNTLQHSYNGLFDLYQDDITLFDIAEHSYIVSGQEGFNLKFLSQNEAIPTRKCEDIKFPSGQLEFNIKVYQDGVKIAHYLLQSRPSQPIFGLNFEIDRNKLIHMHVSTTKGQTSLLSKQEHLSQKSILEQSSVVNDYT